MYDENLALDAAYDEHMDTLDREAAEHAEWLAMQAEFAELDAQDYDPSDEWEWDGDEWDGWLY